MRFHSGNRSDADGWACAYRFYDATDRLLYVGVADDPDTRWRGHARKWWWKNVARKEVIWFERRLDALYEESRAIDTESPLHNRRPGLAPFGILLVRWRGRLGRIVNIKTPVLAVTRWDKDEAFRCIANDRAVGQLAYEGERINGLLVPVGWYKEACRRMGQPVNVGAMPQVHWEEM